MQRSKILVLGGMLLGATTTAVYLNLPTTAALAQEPRATAKTDPMTTKDVSLEQAEGEGQHPLYQFLTSQETQPQPAGEIKWNFEKFLIGKDGKIAARFAPKTQPDSEEVVKAIEAELAK